MKLLSFEEINDLENGMPIPSLTGAVKKVFDQRHGEGDYGPWHLQSFVLYDTSLKEITCTWTGEDTINDLQGKIILIESTFNKKEQLVGIKKEIKTKNGKRYESVKLDDRCKIKPVNGGDATSNRNVTAPTSYEGTRETTTAQNTTQERSFTLLVSAPLQISAEPTSHPEARQDKAWSTRDKGLHGGVGESESASSDGVTEAKRHLVQSANLYNLCVDAVRTMVESHAVHFWPEGLGGEMFRTAVSSLYIESSSRRSTDGVTWWSYLEKMPTKPL
jgi:hypothetical protein